MLLGVSGLVNINRKIRSFHRVHISLDTLYAFYQAGLACFIKSCVHDTNSECTCVYHIRVIFGRMFNSYQAKCLVVIIIGRMEGLLVTRTNLVYWIVFQDLGK